MAPKQLITAALCALMLCGCARTAAPQPTAATAETTAPTQSPAQLLPETTTDPVDNAVSLEDGSYAPDSFSWSGGTGRVSLRCDGITVEEGHAWADIVFTSTAYAYVKANGETFYPEIRDNCSVFRIPAAVNRNNRILAMTTKMSSAHEIAYTFYISCGESPAQLGDLPVIPGLPEGAEIETDAQYFRLCSYGSGICLIEVDAGQAGSALDDAPATTADYASAIYRQNVIRYLAFPRDTELPAGLEKQFILLPTPAHTLYCASASAASTLEKLGTAPALTGDEPDYRQIVKTGVDLAIFPGERRSEMEKTADRFAALGIPLLLDRSCAESTDEGRESWQLLYRIALGMEVTDVH